MTKANSTQSTKFDSSACSHKPFSWIYEDAKDFPMANFVSLTMDVCNGIKTCLELVNTNSLERDYNHDADPGTEALPPLSPAEESNLLRLSMAVSTLLQHEAERTIAWINKYGPEKLKSNQACR